MAAMSIESATRNTTWCGRASTIGLFFWFLYWFKNEPKTPIRQVFLLGGPLALIHWFAILAARRRSGLGLLSPSWTALDNRDRRPFGWYPSRLLPRSDRMRGRTGALRNYRRARGAGPKRAPATMQ